MNILGKFIALFQDRPAPRAVRVDQVTLEDRTEHWDEVAVGKIEALRQSLTGSRTTLAILTAALGLLAPKIKADIAPSDIDGALAIAGDILSGIAGIRAIWTSAIRRWQPTAREVVKPGFDDPQRPKYLGNLLSQRRDYTKRDNSDRTLSGEQKEVLQVAEGDFRQRVASRISDAPETFNAAWLGIITRRAEEIGCPPDELIFRASEHRATGGTLATLANALPHTFAELSK